MTTKRNIFFNMDIIGKLFPFYIHTDQNLKIISVGKSLTKINCNLIEKNFADEFVFKRPFSLEYSIKSISEFLNQVIILSMKSKDNLMLRGQIIIKNNQLYFLGSPWITTEKDFENFNLTIPDFAIHDGVTDMVQLLNAKEIITKDIIQLNEDLKKQKQVLIKSENELRNSNNKLSVLIQNIKGAILLENEERKIVLVNKEFCDIFNISAPPELLIGADCSKAAEQSKIFFKNPDEFVSNINIILNHKKTVQNEELELANGVFLERDFIPIFSNEEYHGHLWIYKNISDRKKYEQEIISSKENAIIEKNKKEQFVANMSHELRNPLNIISGIVSLFENKNLSSIQKEYLNIIKTSSANLLLLVNDILEFEKIEAKKIEFNILPIEIRDLFKESFDALKFQADNKNIKLELKIEPTIPKFLLLDSLRLKQILINLINNAIKFTEKGHVIITVKSKNINDGLIELEIEIEDTGIGIPKKEQKHIFQRFTQTHSKQNLNYSGTGLGLSIVKNLIELQNGVVSFKSRSGFGSTFTVRIPYKVYNHIQNVGIKKTNKIARFNLSKILIVEDNPMNQMILSKMLIKNNASVDVAKDGKVAIEKIKKNNYDLILMDLQMPIMDGFETTIKIRKLKNINKSSIPIIALTANILSKEKEKCFDIGMNGYLNKPISEELLLENLIEILNKKTNLIDLNYLKSIDKDDSSFFINTINSFIKTSPVILSNLKKAANSKQQKEITNLAHKLKGMFAYIGSLDLSDICDKIEKETLTNPNINEIKSYIENLQFTLPKVIIELRKEIL
jgi:signal transduction histidine kinase/CheY-like chemotaxis protein/HPt (histidine-containing phosphotransfer) domain-containing protein